MSTLSKYRAESDALFSQKKQNQDRKKTILIFIQRHLTDLGYVDAASRVAKETNIDLDRVNTADNVDLELIFREYEEYFSFKYGKNPKLISSSTSTGQSLKNVHIAEPGANGVSCAAPNGPNGDGRPGLPPMAPPGGSQYSTRNHNHQQYGVLNADSSLVTNGPAGQLVGPNGIQRMKKSIQSQTPTKGPSYPNTNRNNSNNNSVNENNFNNSSPRVNSEQTQSQQQNSQNLGISGAKISNQQQVQSIDPQSQSGSDTFEAPLFKPLPIEYFQTSELRELALSIQREILTKDPNVRWNDIVGLSRAKQLVSEAVVLPTRYPGLFSGIASPWKGVLLFGPPGTGKTLLAKAVATECKVTFFNISASTIVSKWRGESEKLIRVLFELARCQAPSTIFLDEIDSVMGVRGSGSDGGGEHEGSRRMKTELLIQMDGLVSQSSQSVGTSQQQSNSNHNGLNNDIESSTQQVFLLAASNLPWDLDAAMLRRLEKRIFVPLPCVDARKVLLKNYLKGRIRWAEHDDDEGAIKFDALEKDSKENSIDNYSVDRISIQTLAEKLEGWSGSDIRLLCKEMAMQPLRRCLIELENERKKVDAEYSNANGSGPSGPGSVSNSKGKGKSRLPAYPPHLSAPTSELLGPITRQDVALGFDRVHPAPHQDLQKYKDWDSSYGST